MCARCSLAVCSQLRREGVVVVTRGGEEEQGPDMAKVDLGGWPFIKLHCSKIGSGRALSVSDPRGRTCIKLTDRRPTESPTTTTGSRPATQGMETDVH